MVNMQERVLLVGVQLPSHPNYIFKASLDELEELVYTAGGQVIGAVTQTRQYLDPAYCIGTGLLAELESLVEERNIDTVVFDLELTETQARNLERRLDCKILDRTQVILDIFAQKARTKEGKLQVELAQLKYLLPRLVGRGQELSRLAGGIGTRGPGETKLESDRRRLRRRISILEKEIARIARQRELQRENRQRRQVPTCAIAGYTNAGKSSLLNLLTGIDSFGVEEFLKADTPTKKRLAGRFVNGEVLAEDKLFATLDPTVRQITLPGNTPLNMVDTVGFIQRLPHTLVAAFLATLEEITKADLIIHLVDASHPMREEQLQTGWEVIRMLGAEQSPAIVVFNKIDLLEEQELSLPQGAIGISAKTGQNVHLLYQELAKLLEKSRGEFSFLVPYDQGQVLDSLHQLGDVTRQEYLDHGVLIRATVPHAVAGRFRKYLQT